MQKNKKADFKAILSKYIPLSAVDPILQLIHHRQIQLTIKQGRKTKLGDYRPGNKQSPHRISINKNINQYAFLITLVHEIAHLEVWKNFGRSARPHGQEWRAAFQKQMAPFLHSTVFPDELKPLIIKHLTKGYASTSSDIELTRALAHYDIEQKTLMEDVPETTLFSVDDGRLFRKKHKIRTRYVCYCFNDRKTYLFSPTARVNIQTKK